MIYDVTLRYNTNFTGEKTREKAPKVLSEYEKAVMADKAAKRGKNASTIYAVLLAAGIVLAGKGGYEGVQELRYVHAKNELKERNISIPGDKGKSKEEATKNWVENMGYYEIKSIDDFVTPDHSDHRTATINKWKDVKQNGKPTKELK